MKSTHREDNPILQSYVARLCQSRLAPNVSRITNPVLLNYLDVFGPLLVKVCEFIGLWKKSKNSG